MTADINGDGGVELQNIHRQEGNPTNKNKNDNHKNKKRQLLNTKNDTREENIKKLKAAIGSIVESKVVVAIMSVYTIWALFSDDIRLSGTGKSADLGFEVVISIGFFLFVFEILAACFYKDGYLHIEDWNSKRGESIIGTWMRRLQFGSFYFWLDWIATLTLLFEMSWLTGGSIDSGGTQSAKAGTASRAGARAGRIIRLVRMVRLVRLVKLYKYASVSKSNATTKNGEDEEVRTESKVGAAMSDLTNRRVIILVLTMLIVIPLLTVTETDLSQSLAVQLVQQMALLNHTNQQLYEQGLQMVLDTTIAQTSVIGIKLNNHWFMRDIDRIDSLRNVELSIYLATDPGFQTYMIFDQQRSSINSSLFSIYTTLFIIFLLVGGTFFFSNDVNRLVIIPIEKMVALVQKISADPLGAEYKVMGAKDGFIEGMETTILLTTITKIGGLMRVGFGEAGASVIASNLSDSASGTLNLMGAGTMIESIFGFCDVRQFTDTTECLQEEVMLFVNRIAHILHGIVVQCSGAANKNIGDAFLLTWKLCSGAANTKFPKEKISSLADQALVAFCKSLVELSRYQDFICNFSVAATARLYKRFPGYNVRIGSGLHKGWAIEGAIGSNRKIDASYLSPHVSFTEFLESSTKLYGVPLLLSEEFYMLLSAEAAKYCRCVDRVRRSEAEAPIRLYTYDSDVNIDWEVVQKKREFAANIAPRKTSVSTEHQSANPPANTKKTRKMSEINRDLEAGGTDKKIPVVDRLAPPVIVVPPYTEDVWVEDADLVELRHQVNEGFRSVWATGIEAYIDGNWGKAKEVFDKTLSLSHGRDGPSKLLLEMINDQAGVAPHDWPGYRLEGDGH